MSATILFEQHDGIARLNFNRAERHNALGQAELKAIEHALLALAPDSRVLVISAEGGRTFCAGADLEQIASGELTGDQFQAVTNQIAALPIPSICALNGNVFGGGFELAMSCDFRIAADDIMMRVPAAAIGLCYPIDGIQRIAARLGVTRAKRILIGAEELSAQEMKNFGILDWLVAPADLTRHAESVAAQITRLAPLSVKSMLKVLKQFEAGGIDRVEAAQLSEMCANSRDLQEGLAAQRERRAPNFKGE